jgi:site-specific recombinase XerD
MLDWRLQMSSNKYGIIVNNLVSINRKKHISEKEKIEDHDKILKYYLLSKRLRNHTNGTIYHAERILRNLADSTKRLWWEISIQDVNDYHQALVDSGLAVSTRRGYLSEIRNFYSFLMDHPEIPRTIIQTADKTPHERVDWKYGVSLIQPVDNWFKPDHTCDDIALDKSLPTESEMRAFFSFLRNYAKLSTKPLVYERDYALFRMLYGTGIRMNECCMVDIDDVYFEQNTIHVRFGKGTRGSGRRERWVPMIFHGLKKVLEIYFTQCRPYFPKANINSALFLSERGTRISIPSVMYRLSAVLQVAAMNGVKIKSFTTHDFRRAFATHLYERAPNKVEAIRHILGHSLLSTTQYYLRPSAHYLEEQLKELTISNFQRFMEDTNV